MRFLPIVWRQPCLIFPELAVYSRHTQQHHTCCPLTLIHKLSANSHLSQGRVPSIPTAFSQKKRATAPPNNSSLSFLKSLYPATAALQQHQLSHHICADKELICCAPASARGPRHCPQPQICRAAPSPSGLALGCGLCWVTGSLSPRCWGPSPAGPCHHCWAQKHLQPRPWSPSAQIAVSAGRTPCLMVIQPPPCPRHRLTGCQDDPPWSGFSRNKSWKPLSHKKLFSILIIYHRYHKPGENFTTFFSLRVRKTSS